MHCPFAHYIGVTSDAVLSGYAKKCVEAALQTVLIAEELQKRRILIAVHPFALDAVILATTTLLLSELRTRHQGQTVTIDTSTSGRAVDLLYSLSIQSDSAKSGVFWIEVHYELHRYHGFTFADIFQKMKRDAMKMAANTTGQTVLPPVSDLLRYDKDSDISSVRTSFGNTTLSPFSAASRNIDSNMPDASASATPPSAKPNAVKRHQNRANDHTGFESR